MNGIPSSADQFSKLFDRTYFNILPPKGIESGQSAKGKREALTRTQTPCPRRHFAAIESAETDSHFFNFSREQETCVISTPCCASAISMPR
jgi:hypothetical protein